MISVRPATLADLEGLYLLAEEMEAKNEPKYFDRCLAEQAEKKRELLVALAGSRIIGYVQLVWTPLYSTFRRLGIPEVQDLNVTPEVRGRGFGDKLVQACEDLVRQAGKKEVGISVGLSQKFGPAQRLYVKRGYVPDGAGVCYDDVPVGAGQLWTTLWHRAAVLDSLLTLKLVKNLL